MEKVVKIGPIEFDHYSIKKPNIDTFNKWVEEILPISSSYNIDLWLTSTFIKKLDKARDIDIVVLGDITYADIYDLLKIGYELAYYKYKFKLDMQWYSELLNIYTEENKKRITKYRIMDKVIFGKRVIWDESDISEEIYPGLFKVIKKMPSKKQINYMDGGFIYPIPIKLKEGLKFTVKHGKLIYD